MSRGDAVTLIVSDLHVGGGSADSGDDHVHDRQQFARFVDAQLDTPRGRDGQIELFINGDFLEFAQTDQEVHSRWSQRYWCTEQESLAKLETILSGHAEIFAALARFVARGHRLTLAAGNHDVDLAWPGVQARLRAAVGAAIRFEIGQEWVSRYDGALQIGHGHMDDPANRFEHWDEPIRTVDWGVQRLEMCPGTLFMVKFVNRLEARYPFADNLLPVSKLAGVLWQDDRSGFASVGWSFLRLLATTSIGALDSQAMDRLGPRLAARFQGDEAAYARLADAARRIGCELPAAPALTESLLAELMVDLLGRLDDTQWRALFDLGAGAVTLGETPQTLNALRASAFDDMKLKLRRVAQQRADETGARVVVMGHTHQPDQLALEGGAQYVNPGCWTRYLELPPGQHVRLADLQDESRYPYALNVVRIERAGGDLVAHLECIERG